MNSSVQLKIDNFFKSYSERHYKKGHVLLYAGDTPPHVYYLLEGQVRQYDITQSGNEVVVYVFQKPVMIPSWLAINKTQNLYFFDALDDISVRAAPSAEFVKFLEQNGDVTLDLLSRVFLGVEEVQRRAAYMMSGNVRGRLLFELVYECKRFGKRNGDGSYLIRVTESHLSQRSGLSRETISRHVQHLDHGSIIEVTRKGIIVKDLPKLQELLNASVF